MSNEVPTSAATPVNVQPADDPCKVQPGVFLEAFLMANATPAKESVFLDCFVPRDFRMRQLFPPRVIADRSPFIRWSSATWC